MKTSCLPEENVNKRFSDFNLDELLNESENSTSQTSSLIIHQVKTKKITTVKEVWIRGLN